MGRPTAGVEQEAAALTPRHCHPDVAAEILRAVREARGLPAEATVLTIPPRKKDRQMNSFSSLVRVGNNAELKTIGDSQTQVCNVRLAVSTGRGDRCGTMWLDGKILGSRGAALAGRLTKGQQLFVTGELSTREYTNRDGSKGMAIELTIDRLDFVGPRPDSASDEPAPVSKFGAHPTVLEDIVPF